MLGATLAAVGIGALFAALNVRYRDVRYIIPFLVQLWIFVTPVAYSANLVPGKWRWAYAINPMVGVVEGFRWAFLGSALSGRDVAISGLSAVVMLFVGLLVFGRMEDTFVDVILTATAIEVSGLGKQYVLGERQQYQTLRDALVERSAPAHSPGRDRAIPRQALVLACGRCETSTSSVQRRRGARHHRPQRGRQEHAAEDPQPHHRADRRASRRSAAASAVLLEVGTGFHPELTGRENIFLNGAILGMRASEIERKFDEIVAFAEVERFLDTPVKRYSSGMYVRLAFAVAAHLEPEILIVDEVLAVGDAEFQKKCLGKMSEVAQTRPHGAVRQPQPRRGAAALPPQHLVGPRRGAP